MSNPASIRRERIEYLVTQLEEFIKTVVTNMNSPSIEDAVMVIRMREQLVNALIDESRL